LKIIIDSMDSIAKDNNVSHADRLNAERIKLDALALLRDAIEASIFSSNPHTALKKLLKRATAVDDWNVETVNVTTMFDQKKKKWSPLNKQKDKCKKMLV
jgi:hypothetical protein